MKVITLKQVYKMLSEVCNLFNKNNIQYLIYGSVALNLLTSQEQDVNDIDIIVKEVDFEKIKKILPDKFTPIQTEFSIHTNSNEFLGKNNKPFDVSIDSYEHYFQKHNINLLNTTKKEINGVEVNITPINSLKKIYKIGISTSLDTH